MKTYGMLFVLMLFGVEAIRAVEQAALFVDTETYENEDKLRHSRQVDQAVQSILKWLQGRYARTATYDSNNRRSTGSKEEDAFESQPVRQYLPAPESTEKPRPFQPPGGYPHQPQPQPSFEEVASLSPSPSPSPSGGGQLTGTFETSASPDESGSALLAGGEENTGTVTEGSIITGGSAVSQGGIITGGNDVSQGGIITGGSDVSQGSIITGGNDVAQGSIITGGNDVAQGGIITGGNGVSQGGIIAGGDTLVGSSEGGTASVDTGDHPPHIHAIDVQCAKEQMTISIEFSATFNGVIYSKGFYGQPNCRYVQPNSGQTAYSFTVSLNSCGTQFIERFKEEGQAYLENVLVLQNEPGIQEVWDTVRRVRCLWEGKLNQALTVAVSVGMLSEEAVTFSGDTAMARLDIKSGRGPFGETASGLVKIGQPMTLVVSVEGDPGFDIQVRDCIARDSTETNVVQLTDERGCVLKKKLFGAFQKTKDTGSFQTSVIAYAYFQAFKFPDIMDLTIDCNVELCKTDCQICPEPNQSLDPVARRRRETGVEGNQTLGDPVKLIKVIRVISPEDIDAGSLTTIITVDSAQAREAVCMSLPSFLAAAALLIVLLIGSCLLCALLWLRSSANARRLAKTIMLDKFPATNA